MSEWTDTLEADLRWAVMVRDDMHRRAGVLREALTRLRTSEPEAITRAWLKAQEDR